ncbi:exodeoxyribonuclease V subunit alpha, partial [Pseudomonas sp. HMWF031]
MIRSEGAQRSLQLGDGVMAMLRRRRPPAADLSATDQQALEELVQALTAALSAGDTSLRIEENQRELLERSGWLTDPPQVMVLDGDQLHWTRWHQAMQRLELELIDRSHAQPSGSLKTDSLPTDSLPPDLGRLNTEQRAAVQAIRRHRLVMVSGGPGTGKTSTVQAMLLQAMAERGALR